MVWVDSLQTDTLSFDKTNGKKRTLILTGNIDYPYQGPSGDFWDSEAASCLSFKPIEIRLFESPSHLHRILRADYGDEAVGKIRTKDAEEIAQWTSDIVGYSPPPISALLELPREVLETIREQLSRCQSENRFLYLTLKFRVLEPHVGPEAEDFNKEYGLSLADIDFSEKREFEVFNIQTAASHKKEQAEAILDIR